MAGKLPTNTRVFPAIGSLGEAGGVGGASCSVAESLAAIADDDDAAPVVLVAACCVGCCVFIILSKRR